MRFQILESSLRDEFTFGLRGKYLEERQQFVGRRNAVQIQQLAMIEIEKFANRFAETGQAERESAASVAR